MDKAAKEPQVDKPEEQKPVAVRSAKDAINAMYADQQKSGLGDYLAMSAREIVNATTEQKKGAEAKSAANLHKHASDKKLESVRMSASALMKMSNSKAKAPSNRLQAVDPIAHKKASLEATKFSEAGPEKIESKVPTVVRTSLKLKPKKPTVKLPAASQQRPGTGIRLPKQQISLNRVHTHNPQVFQDVMRPSTDLKKPTAESPESIKSLLAEEKLAQSSIISQNTKKVNSEESGVPSDGSVKVNLGKKPKPIAAKGAGVRLKKKTTSDPYDVEKPVLKPGMGSTHTKANPLDSIKRKFAPAPKGFAANNSKAARPNRPYQVEDYLNPSHATKAVPATDDATHYYGLSEEELVGNAKGVQVNRDQMAAEAGLGMIEDYDSGKEATADQSATILRRDAPDNNKYALSAQSPYYLKPEKEMKKRPLSGNGEARIPSEVATSVQAAQDLAEELPKKNQYKKNSKKAKKSKQPAEKKEKKPNKTTKTRDINQPTMIIPAHHRSNAPLVALLLLTVILGATVGALAYLFFFQ